MKTQWTARQGDVLIIADNNAPTGTEIPRDRGRVVLAYGEVTGHAHTIIDPGAALFDLAQGSDGATLEDRVLVVPSAATLTHEEHDAIIIPPGRYRVIRQREYTPQEIRSVAD